MSEHAGTFNLDSIASWFEQLATIPQFREIGGFSYQLTDPLLPVFGTESDIRTMLSMLAVSALLNTQPGDSVLVHGKAVPTSVDITLQLRPSPLFILLFKNLSESQERQHSARTIQTSPDAMITLLMAQKLATRNRARIWLQLDKERGAGLHVYLPTMPVLPGSERAQPLVLIIEDTKMIGNLMELYLRQTGFRTMLAYDGISGLKLAQDFKPDMVTLDVMMPEMDGWQVLLELKSDERTRAIPVVIVSVLKDRQIGFELGASDYLTKPVVREELTECAQRLTSRPVPVSTSLPAQVRHWVLFTGDESATASLSGAFDGAIETVLDISNQKFFESLLNREVGPELFVIDFREHFHKALMVLCRLRLHDSFDVIPVVALHEDAQLPLIRQLTEGLVNVHLASSALSAQGLAAACAAAYPAE